MQAFQMLELDKNQEPWETVPSPQLLYRDLGFRGNSWILASTGIPEILEVPIEPRKTVVVACPGETWWGSIACLAQLFSAGGPQKYARSPGRNCCLPSVWLKSSHLGKETFSSFFVASFKKKKIKIKCRFKCY